jgi:hypothetical protein
MKNVPPHIKEKIDKLTGELKAVYELAEQSWEGCDGCDENDKYFYMKGFQAGYNTAKPDEISDEEALRLAKNMNKQPMTFVPAEISDEDIKRKIKREYWISNNEEKRLMIEGAIWYREQLKN